MTTRPGRRFALLAVAVALLGVAGLAGYVAYPRLGLPGAVGIAAVPLAVAAGVAAFFSPCSFPLLLTLLARRREETGGRPSPLLWFAGAFSVGALTFLGTLGALLGLGGRTFVGSVTFASTTGITLRLVVGAILLALGAIQAGFLPVSFHAVEPVLRPLSAVQARVRRRHPLAGAAGFGFVYLLIGFG